MSNNKQKRRSKGSDRLRQRTERIKAVNEFKEVFYAVNHRNMSIDEKIIASTMFNKGYKAKRKVENDKKIVAVLDDSELEKSYEDFCMNITELEVDETLARVIPEGVRKKKTQGFKQVRKTPCMKVKTSQKPVLEEGYQDEISFVEFLKELVGNNQQILTQNIRE